MFVFQVRDSTFDVKNITALGDYVVRVRHDLHCVNNAPGIRLSRAGPEVLGSSVQLYMYIDSNSKDGRLAACYLPDS